MSRFKTWFEHRSGRRGFSTGEDHHRPSLSAQPLTSAPQVASAPSAPLIPSAPPTLLHPPSLTNLPFELLYSINDFLSVSDRACLSLCNRVLCHNLRSTTWNLIRIGHDDLRTEFLVRLVRDHPRYAFCPCDSCLRPSTRIGPPGPPAYSGRMCSQRRLDEVPHHCFDNPAGLRYYCFEFQHLQSAMLRHRRGSSYGIALDTLSNTEVHRMGRKKLTILMSVDSRILSNELCLRVQQWIMPDPGEELSEALSISFPRISYDTDLYSGPEMRQLCECKLRHANQRVDCLTCSPLLQCGDCAIEFQTDYMDYAPHGQAFFITRWLNMGSGETPLDPKWRRHLPKSDCRARIYSVVATDREHSIRSSFEQQGDKSLQSITEENASILRDKRYETIFTYLGECDTWVRRVKTSKRAKR